MANRRNSVASNDLSVAMISGSPDPSGVPRTAWTAMIRPDPKMSAPPARVRRLFLDKGNLTRKAKAVGLTTVVIASTREATEAVAARAALKREQTILQLYGFMSEALNMHKTSHVIFVGQAKRPVTIEGLLPHEFLHVATAVVKVDQVLDRELRRSTGR